MNKPLPENVKVTGNWDGEVIWRETTSAERLAGLLANHDHRGSPEEGCDCEAVCRYCGGTKEVNDVEYECDKDTGYNTVVTETNKKIPCEECKNQ